MNHLLHQQIVTCSLADDPKISYKCLLQQATLAGLAGVEVFLSYTCSLIFVATNLAYATNSLWVDVKHAMNATIPIIRSVD